MNLIKGIWYIFLIDHIIVEPATGKHHFVWRR